MYFLFLTIAVSAAVVTIDTTSTPPDSVLQTNLVSSGADPVLEGSMDTNIQDPSMTQHAFDLPAQPLNSDPTPNLDQTIPLAFNEVPYPEFLEEKCKLPKQLGCCWVQNGRKFCDYFSNIESKECANHQNWRCCDKINRIEFIGINCRRFQVKDPVPKKDEQPQDQQSEELQPPEQLQSFPDETWDLPDWLNWMMFPGAADTLWQNQ